MSRIIKDFGHVVRVRKYYFMYWRTATARVRQGWSGRFLSLYQSEGFLFIFTSVWTQLGHDDVKHLLGEVNQFLEQSAGASAESDKFEKLFGRGGRRSPALRLSLDRGQALRFKGVLQDAVDLLASR